MLKNSVHSVTEITIFVIYSSFMMYLKSKARNFLEPHTVSSLFQTGCLALKTQELTSSVISDSASFTYSTGFPSLKFHLCPSFIAVVSVNFQCKTL